MFTNDQLVQMYQSVAELDPTADLCVFDPSALGAVDLPITVRDFVEILNGYINMGIEKGNYQTALLKHGHHEDCPVVEGTSSLCRSHYWCKTAERKVQKIEAVLAD